MARDLNKVLLIGNLTRDVDLRVTQSGKPVCSFGLATKRTWTSEQGDKKEDVQYHQIVGWGPLAELCHQLLRKGSRAYVEGRLDNREYEKDGEKRVATEVVINDMILLDSRAAGSGRAIKTPSQTKNPPVMSPESYFEE